MKTFFGPHMAISFSNIKNYTLILIVILISKNICASEFDNNYNHCYGNKIKYFKVFGERCSGTNFLSRLIRSNFPELSKQRRFGHKHFICWFDFPMDVPFMQAVNYPDDYYTLENSDDFLFLVILRDPYDWVRSFYQSPWVVPDEIKNHGFSHFIHSSWKNSGVYSRIDDYNPYTKTPFQNVLELRKYKTINYLSMGKKVKNFCLVRYEDLEKDPTGFLEYLSRKYNLALSQIYYPREIARKII